MSTSLKLAIDQALTKLTGKERKQLKETLRTVTDSAKGERITPREARARAYLRAVARR